MFRRLAGPVVLLGMAVTLFTGSPAFASGISWSGDVRVRYEADDRSFQKNVDFESTVFQRSRVKAVATNDEGAEAVVELQDSRVWGDEGNTLADTENVDVAQAYLHVEQPGFRHVEWFIGRQNLEYGAGRVFSAVDWDNVGRSFDGVRLRVGMADDNWFDAGFAKVADDMVAATDQNVAFLIAHWDVQDTGLMLEPLLVYKEDSVTNQFLTSLGDHGRFEQGRVKVYQDFVYQTGKVMGHDASAYLFNGMLALDVSKEQNGRAGIGAGYSIYSGDDPTDTDDSAYDNLYFDYHRYHGYMDVAQSIVDPFGLGLKDFFGKAWFETPQGVWLKGAFHHFQTDIDVTLTSGDRNSLGNEFDFGIGKDLSSGMSAEVGGGWFSPGDVAEFLVGTESAAWLYAQGNVAF